LSKVLILEISNGAFRLAALNVALPEK